MLEWGAWVLLWRRRKRYSARAGVRDVRGRPQGDICPAESWRDRL